MDSQAPNRPRIDRILSALPRLRLGHLLLAAMTLALVIAEAVTLVPSMLFWQKEEVERITQDTLSLLRANVDATTFPSVAATVKAGERLMAVSAVRGGVIVNMLGGEVGAFGNSPTLKFAAARRNEAAHQSPDGAYLDIFFSQYKTGLAFPVILRIDSSVISAAVFRRLLETFFVVLGVALIASVVLGTIIALAVIRPVLRLRDAAIAATEDPRNAERYRLRWSRQDELGEAARTLDGLLAGLSMAQHDEVFAAHEALMESGLALMSYDDNARLLSANVTALKLLDAGTVDELAKRPSAFLRDNRRQNAAHLSPLDVVRGGRDEIICSLVTPQGLRHCHIGIMSVRRHRDQAMLYHTFIIADISEQVAYAHHLEDENRRLSDHTARLKQRLSEQRQLFESCTIIMSNLQTLGQPMASAQGTGDFIDIEDVVEEWCTEALRNGLITGRLVSGRLPAIRGDAGHLAAVFRQALLAAYTRSPLAKPAIGISVRQAVISGELSFDVFSAAAEGSGSDVAGPERASAAPIAMLGLQRALSQIGGRIIASRAGEDDLAFGVPAAQGGFRRHAA